MRVFRRRVRSHYHDHGAGVEATRTAYVCGASATVADCAELCRELSVIAIVWLNHHHLLRFAEYPTPHLIWINFAHLFMVSLVPFSTAWVARTRLAAGPVFVYAAVFVLVELAYVPFERHVLAQAGVEEISPRTRRLTTVRSLVALGIFVIAMLVSLKVPFWGFGLTCCALLLYLRPQPPGTDLH
jgi:uncharacterized membrane protein